MIPRKRYESSHLILHVDLIDINFPIIFKVVKVALQLYQLKAFAKITLQKSFQIFVGKCRSLKGGLDNYTIITQ